MSHDHHSCLPKVNSQIVILRQGQVAQETLVWTQRGCEDLQIKAIEVLISLIINNYQGQRGYFKTGVSKQQTFIWWQSVWEVSLIVLFLSDIKKEKPRRSPQLPLQEPAPPCCSVCSESAAGEAAEERWFPGWSARCPSLWCRFPTAGAAAERQTAADWRDTMRKSLHFSCRRISA